MLRVSLWQGLQRRATPHPSELKVMKKVIEVRRNEVNAAKADANPSSPNSEVSAGEWITTENMGSWNGLGWKESYTAPSSTSMPWAETSSTRNM